VIRLEDVNIGGTVLDRPQLLKVGGFDVADFKAGTIYRTGKISFDHRLEAEVSYLHPQVEAPVMMTLLQDADWFAVAPNVPKVKVRVANPGSYEADVTVRLEISPDKVEGFDWTTGSFSSAWLPPIVRQTQTASLAPGEISTIEIDVDLPEPGFYRCRVVDADSGATLGSFNIGRDPEQIVSPRDAQPDFEEFWQKARADLDMVDPKISLTLIPEQSNSVREVYRVEMRSLGGILIRGIYAKPTGAGKHPAIIQYAGYGGGSSAINPNSNPDYAEFHLSTRGQGISTPNVYGEWIAYGIDNKNNHYYRGGFMDLVRGVDFLVSRPEVDARYIFATGGSQGGAYTMAAAALDDRIAGAAPTIPFLSDYPDYVEITPFVANKIMPRARALGLSQEEMLRTMSYFDIKNLAGWITCPVIMGFGLQDETCPPHTNFAGYNQITSEKTYYPYAQNAHSVGGDWTALRNAFFNRIRSGN
jgi:cephalosporin-C deacetylase